MNNTGSDLISTALDLIQYHMTRCRKYASHFEWFDKHIKEKGVVKELFESMQREEKTMPNFLRASSQDPPDCVAEDCHGNQIGIEVTELVYERAIRLNEKGERVFRLWEPEEVVSDIERILRDKDSKVYKGGPYSQLWLIIYTAEGTITHREMLPLLETHLFSPTKQITDAFFLFSYDPRTQSYPYMRLKVAEK